MIIKFFGFLAVLAVSLNVSAGEQVASAEQALQPAKIIIYRADESSKTRRVKFDARADGVKLGRMNYSTPLVAEVAPGALQLGTCVAGTESLEIRVQPGQTYYVHTQVKKLGHTLKPTLVLVEEQVALAQQPAIDGTI